MRLLGKFLGNGETVFNVGANVGYLGLWLARHAQRKGHAVQVIGFEPEPTNLAQMHRNVALNPSLSVICEPIALGNFDGSADFYSTSTGNGDGAASFKPRQAATRVKVTVRKLDSYLAGEGVKPDWLILDVEGSGGDVIAGGQKTIRQHRPKIAAEIHSADEHAGIADEIEPLGYRLRCELRSLWGHHALWLPY